MARVSRKQKVWSDVPNIPTKREKEYIVGAYTRLSKEEERDDHKLDNQEQVIQEFVRNNPQFFLYKIYRDNGCTGTNFQRPAFEQLMKDVKQGVVNCIIVKDLSRLGRNHIETEQYIQVLFPVLDIRFIAINDNFDTLNPDNDITVSLKNIVNEAYAKDISRKIFSAKQTQRLRGDFVGNIPPFGYEKAKENPRRLVINEETGPVIKRIFLLKLEGKTNTEIAKTLNAMGEIAPMTYWYRRGKVHHEKYANRIWESTTVKVILRNQMYVGDMVQGKKQKCLAEGRTQVKAQRKEDYVIVKNMHEPIIDRATFDRVQQICDEELQRNREKRNQHHDIPSTEGLLDGIIFSIEGQKMYRVRKVYENQRITYNYVTHKIRKHDGRYSTFFYISEIQVFRGLKQAVFTHIKLLFTLERLLKNEKYKKKAVEEQRCKESKIVQLKGDLNKCTEKIASLYKDMCDGILTFTEYEELKAQYVENREYAKAKLQEIETGHLGAQLLSDYHNKNRTIYEAFLERGELTRELLQLLIKKVVVVEKNKITVTFRFEDEIGRLYTELGIEGVK